MTNTQRMKSDISTTDRREIADKTRRDGRVRNDNLTTERRLKADKTLGENRSRNDEITANRRELKDGGFSFVFAVSILILITLAVGTLFVFS